MLRDDRLEISVLPGAAWTQIQYVTWDSDTCHVEQSFVPTTQSFHQIYTIIET